MYGSIRIDAIAHCIGPFSLNHSNALPTISVCLQEGPWLELTARSTDAGLVIAARSVENDTCRAVCEIPADDSFPHLPWGQAAIERIVAIDVLEHVIDEASWLRSMVEVLAPGGELILRVPLEGPVAWLDALNLVRYAQDITGWAKQREEAGMKMWHRHYRPSDLKRLLTQAGLTVVDVEQSGSPHLELLQLGEMLFGNICGQCRATERHETANMVSASSAILGPRLGPLSTKLTIRAVKPADGSF